LTLKILGFKSKRLTEWRVVVKLESRSVAEVALKAILHALLHPNELLAMNRRRWRQKMRVCAKCPVYDPVLKRCRPYTGSVLGCGCYVPFMAVIEGHCWMRRAFGSGGW
jgi:hypothetical protein